MGKEGARELFQPSGNRAVDQTVSHRYANAADEGRIALDGDVEFFSVDAFEAFHQRTDFRLAELTRRRQGERFRAARLRFQLAIFRDYGAENGFTPLADQQEERIERDIVDLRSEHLGENSL